MRTPFVNAEGKKLQAKTVVEAAKMMAKDNVRHPSLITMLRRWWTDKYKLPWTPKNIDDFTVLDLLTEYYEDLFEKDKTALFEASRGEDGEIIFESTGDELIDKWEQELAMGIEPDLTEGMAAADRVALLEEQAFAQVAKEKVKQVTDIDEKFDRGLMSNPMYTTKTAGELQALGTAASVKGLSPLDLLGKGK